VEYHSTTAKQAYLNESEPVRKKFPLNEQHGWDY